VTGKQTKNNHEETSNDFQAVKPVDWEDFRDHLATADKEGHRQWLYPKKPQGQWHRRRVWISVLLLAVMFAGPFIRINGNPLLLVNLIERRFSILGQLFWPQDSAIAVVALLLFALGIVLFTTAFGRLWCGWTCPQTLLMEMVFRKIEYAIEGDNVAQRALDAGPWTRRKLAVKATKHTIFFLLSFLIGNTLLSYIIGTEELFKIVIDPPRQHLVGLSFMTGFTLVFYSIFARFREQACTFICPYGRLQSTMLDENTMVVAYDHKRGEQRGPIRRASSAGASAAKKAGRPGLLPDPYTVQMARRESGLGDCVNCRQCVSVCPTGIDIRNGTQMECVNCTACIDACDAIMDRVGFPRGLIRYASLNSIESGEHFQITPRMRLYAGVLLLLGCLLGFLVFTRADTETTLLRAPGALYQRLNDGRIENLYTLKIINKTMRDIPVQLRLENVSGAINLMGTGKLSVPKAGLAQTSVLIALEPQYLQGPRTKLTIGVYSGDKRLETLQTIFVGPRDETKL
jgi:cytochrome c oxidase accessory protein FixG